MMMEGICCLLVESNGASTVRVITIDDGDCPDDTDIRRHMSRRPLTDWGMIIVTEFKAKGVRPMEKELTAFIKDESLQMAEWPCRDYYRVSSDRIRQAKLRR